MMIRVISITGLLIVLGSMCLAQADNFYVSISLVVSEHSRDSHSTKTSFVIMGRKVVYDETYFGYRSNSRSPVHKEYVFTKQEIGDLKDLIQQRDLLRSRSFVIASTDVPYTTYELNEDIKWKGKRGLIKVFGSQKSLAEAEAKNRGVYEDANALLEYVREKVRMKGEAQ